MVKKEVEMFDVRRAEEFKAGVVTYLEAMLRSQVRKSPITMIFGMSI